MPDIDDDYPEITEADLARATHRIGGRVVSKGEWKASVRSRIALASISREPGGIELIQGICAEIYKAGFEAGTKHLIGAITPAHGWPAVRGAPVRARIIKKAITADDVLMVTAMKATEEAIIAAVEPDEKKNAPYKEKHRRHNHFRRLAAE